MMKLRYFTTSMLIFIVILMVGCSNGDNEEAHDDANVRHAAENMVRACLEEKNKSEETWSFSYDEERHIFTSASERICLSHYGNIIHSGCENVFPVLGSVPIVKDDEPETTSFIEYNIERMNIQVDFDVYRHMENHSFTKPFVIPYDRLRGPERYRMERVASCLNAANIFLRFPLKNRHSYQ